MPTHKTTPDRSGVVEESCIDDGVLLFLILGDELLADFDDVHAGVLDLLHHAAGHRVEVVVELSTFFITQPVTGSR